MSLNKKTLLLLAILLGVLSEGIIPVEAADVFLRPKVNIEGPTPTPEQNDVLELLDEAPPVVEAEPEPESIEDFANRYYKNCSAQEHQFLKGDDLQLLCGCTSAKIPEVMTVQQMRDMQNDSQEGQAQRARMLLFVYTPCISFPTRALVLNQCLNNPDVRSTMKQYRRICECLGDRMAEYMDKEAPDAMQAALTRNLVDADPLRALMESRGFNEYSQYYMKQCVEKHEFGIGR